MSLDQVLRTQAQEVNTTAPIYAAKVTRVVSTTEIYVVAPTYSDFEYGPVKLAGPQNPVVGDECLLQFDSDNEPWIHKREPASSTVLKSGDAAGGVLSGTYPNPGFAADMATQAELDGVNSALDTRLDTLEAAPTWTPLTGLYLNSWTEYDTARYSKDALGYVQLRGEIRAWTGGTTASDVAVLGTFPAGFRPAIRTGCPVWANDGTQLSLYVTSSGNIHVSRAVGASVVVNIGSVRFPTV